MDNKVQEIKYYISDMTFAQDSDPSNIVIM